MSSYHWKTSKELKTPCNDSWQILQAVVREHYLCQALTKRSVEAEGFWKYISAYTQRYTLFFQGSYGNCNNNCTVGIQVVWLELKAQQPPLCLCLHMSFYNLCGKVWGSPFTWSIRSAQRTANSCAVKFQVLHCNCILIFLLGVSRNQ